MTAQDDAVEIVAEMLVDKFRLGAMAPRKGVGRGFFAAQDAADLLAQITPLLVAEERERCAKIVDPAANAKDGLWARNLRCKAAAIRARPAPPGEGRG